MGNIMIAGSIEDLITQGTGGSVFSMVFKVFAFII